MLKSEQSVEGNNNLQAGRDINQYGISYADAKEIALDIYRNELPYLTKLASDKAWERVEPVLNEILAQIHQKKPEAINEFAEPEVQYMLGSAMKTASSTDDSVVHDTLVQLAVEHVLSEERSYDRIVDGQAIEVLQKMNRDVLRSLQELAFWNMDCRFISEKNIREYLTYGQYPYKYANYLNTIGCAKPIDAAYYFENESTQHELAATKIQEIYGKYLHVDVSRMEDIATTIFEQVVDKKVFMEFFKTCDDRNSRWVDCLRTILLPYAPKFNNLLDKYSLISEFRDKAFSSIEEIILLIKHEARRINFNLFDYELTPIGYCLQHHLPALIDIHNEA